LIATDLLQQGPEIPFLLHVRSRILVAQCLHPVLPLLVARMKAIFCIGLIGPKPLLPYH